MADPGTGDQDGAGQEKARLDPEIAALVIEMMPQAKSEAWKIYQTAPHALSLDELTSLAYTGLVMAGARWPVYCASRGYDPKAVNYFAAYSLRRIRGAMLDAMRSADWVTRSMRSRAKALREAGLDAGKTEEELAEATGLSARQIREAVAGVAGRPVSFDAETHDVPDAGDVGEQVVVSGILAAVLTELDQMDAQTQVIIALRYHRGAGFGEIAAALGIPEEAAIELHNAGILAIHNVMLRAVTLAGGICDYS
jgi:RNA polymerase sigma factor FliA